MPEKCVSNPILLHSVGFLRANRRQRKQTVGGDEVGVSLSQHAPPLAWQQVLKGN
jgi:urease accessory protein UreE